MSIISFKKNINKYLALSILILFSFGCKKEEKKCRKIWSCVDVVREEIKKRDSALPVGGATQINDSTLFVTFFDYSISSISKKWVIFGCDCELVYFDDERPYK